MRSAPQLYVGVVKDPGGLQCRVLWRLQRNQSHVSSHLFSLQLVAYTFVPFPNPELF